MLMYHVIVSVKTKNKHEYIKNEAELLFPLYCSILNHRHWPVVISAFGSQIITTGYLCLQTFNL